MSNINYKALKHSLPIPAKDKLNVILSHNFSPHDFFSPSVFYRRDIGFLCFTITLLSNKILQQGRRLFNPPAMNHWLWLNVFSTLICPSTLVHAVRAFWPFLGVTWCSCLRVEGAGRAQLFPAPCQENLLGANPNDSVLQKPSVLAAQALKCQPSPSRYFPQQRQNEAPNIETWSFFWVV